LAVGVRNSEGVADHAAAPGQTSPAYGVGCDDLKNNVVRLTGRDIGGRGYAEDDVGGKGCCCFRFGEREAGFLVNVGNCACVQWQWLGRRSSDRWVFC
jgi:hypothetical protein